MDPKVKVECRMREWDVRLLDEWAERMRTTRAGMVIRILVAAIDDEQERRAVERKERLFKGVPDVVVEP